MKSNGWRGGVDIFNMPGVSEDASFQKEIESIMNYAGNLVDGAAEKDLAARAAVAGETSVLSGDAGVRLSGAQLLEMDSYNDGIDGEGG